MANLPYDADRARNLVVIVPNNTGISVPGTAASDTVLLRIPVAVEGLKLNQARIRAITGGTAAGPTITIGKSVGGTGAVTAIGTQAFGTNANGSVFTTTLTSTEFDEGDEIVVTNVAGTVASTPAIIFSLGYKG